MTHAITRDPDTMHGVAVFQGTRVPVQTLFDYLEGGDTLEEFLEGFPPVPRALALEALEEARVLLLDELLMLSRPAFDSCRNVKSRLEVGRQH
jgi:uncharacterized protein (DUF433 family)